MLMLLTFGSNKVSHGFCNRSPSIYKRTFVEPMEWGNKWILLIFGSKKISNVALCSSNITILGIQKYLC